MASIAPDDVLQQLVRGKHLAIYILSGSYKDCSGFAVGYRSSQTSNGEILVECDLDYDGPPIPIQLGQIEFMEEA